MSILHTLRRVAGTAALTIALTAGGAVVAAAPAHAASLPPIGSTLCHSSPTAGLQCGTLTATNLTIAFPGGTVFGAFRYNACPSAGDQGIPVINPQTGQQVGTVIGGSGNCGSGGVTYGLPS